MIDNETRKQEFKNILLSTGRQGVENVVNWLEHNSDFFRAPSSANYHCNFAGGLLQHSLNVYKSAMDIYNNLKLSHPEKVKDVSEDNIKIAALLHDICKVNLYQESVKWKKDENDNWQQIPAYIINEVMPLGHGEKSVIMLQMLGLQMTLEEMCAIRWHMGVWDGGLLQKETKYAHATATDKFPICVIIQCADYISSLVIEEKVEM